MHVNIRRVTVDDAEIIAEHRHALFAEVNWGNQEKRQLMQTNFIPYVRKVITEGKYLGWLAEISDEVVASAGVFLYDWLNDPDHPTGCRAYLVNVYTEQRYRRLGIARNITKLIIEWCKNAGFSRLLLHTNDASFGLYRSLGFEPTTEMQLKL